MSRRCTRGHFIPATAPTDACRCTLTRRPKRRPARWPLDTDLWGQGLTAVQRHSIRTVPIVGSYL
ncbi:hypothetical protein [Streptomyces sp. M92]|uniref:hypothetical protein n=1 Tax=Streptomyces sp. M92 TaxID=2944250 RepID=UPI002348F15F|nr:hypothetical protein [Streptomyces sp. M92]WCN06029.1 hypothetical protein M6G08_30300 [Streptomyces sp. M92]